ncbi:hypothetical protein JCM18899A_43360 [Nocardioides sp. AN3]
MSEPNDLILEADLRKAVRTLMRRPLLHSGRDHDDLALVRRHRAELTRLFADGLGYRLVVEPGLARLFKTGLPADVSRGLARRNGVPFTPRRYLMLALTLAALLRARRQVMVDELVAGVRSAAVDAGVDVDLDSITERRALHSALLALIDIGVLSERDGDLEHWAERQTASLLDIHRDRLAVLLSAPMSGVITPEELLEVASVPSSAGGARVAVRRLLAERPVLSVEDLTDEQEGWWRRNREREREWFRRVLGLDLELRAEGAVAIDSGGDLTDLVFPGAGSARHLALLLLGELVEILRAATGKELEGVTWGRVAASTARSAADRIVVTWRKGLRKAYQEDPNAAYADAVGILEAAGLVRQEESSLLVHAAAARYAPRPELITAPGGQRSLFEEDE